MVISRLTERRFQAKPVRLHILPFTLLLRLEGVLESSKEAVLAQVEKVQAMNLPKEAQEKLLLRATGGLSFYNITKMNLSTLGIGDIGLE